MKNLGLLFILSTCVGFIQPSISGSKFPPFIKVCKRNAEGLKCVLDNVERCREHLHKGIPRLAIPPMDPFIVPSLEVSGNNLKILLKNLKISNLLGLKVVGGDIKWGYSLILNLTVPYIHAEFEYEAEGRVLLLAFKGDGTGHVRANNLTIDIEAISHPAERNGHTYLDVDEILVKYTTTGGMFHVDNLFKGQEELNNATNKLVNDNFVDFNNEISSDIAKSISTLVDSIARTLFGKFTFEELFPKG